MHTCAHVSSLLILSHLYVTSLIVYNLTCTYSIPYSEIELAPPFSSASVPISASVSGFPVPQNKGHVTAGQCSTYIEAMTLPIVTCEHPCPWCTSSLLTPLPACDIYPVRGTPADLSHAPVPPSRTHPPSSHAVSPPSGPSHASSATSAIVHSPPAHPPTFPMLSTPQEASHQVPPHFRTLPEHATSLPARPHFVTSPYHVSLADLSLDWRSGPSPPRTMSAPPAFPY